MKVGSSGGKMIVNSGKWPCGVCGKRVQTNSVQCTVCKKWIHRRCSGVCGDLSRVANGFRCRQCDGTIQEVDLAEDLMADTYKKNTTSIISPTQTHNILQHSKVKKPLFSTTATAQQTFPQTHTVTAIDIKQKYSSHSAVGKCVGLGNFERAG